MYQIYGIKIKGKSKNWDKIYTINSKGVEKIVIDNEFPAIYIYGLDRFEAYPLDNVIETYFTEKDMLDNIYK